MFSSLVAFASLLGTPPETLERPSYLFKTGEPAERGLLYRPQPGDILLFDRHSPFAAKLYRCCGTAGPMHAGMVVPRHDGKLGVLEAGTDGIMKVLVFDLDPRLHEFDGTILVRTPRKPLSKEQARQLEDFATEQEGKPYAIGRVVFHAATHRVRSAISTDLFGRTVLDRNRWFCSELVAASVAAAGIWPAEDFPANVMYPRDLCFDERFDMSPYYEAPVMWYPRPELEMVGKGVRVIPPRER